jgi:uncharacterized membrane protein (DUF106 family)
MPGQNVYLDEEKLGEALNKSFENFETRIEEMKKSDSKMDMQSMYKMQVESMKFQRFANSVTNIVSALHMTLMAFVQNLRAR